VGACRSRTDRTSPHDRYEGRATRRHAREAGRRSVGKSWEAPALIGNTRFNRSEIGTQTAVHRAALSLLHPAGVSAAAATKRDRRQTLKRRPARTSQRDPSRETFKRNAGTSVAVPPKSDTGYARKNKIDDVSAVQPYGVVSRTSGLREYGRDGGQCRGRGEPTDQRQVLATPPAAQPARLDAHGAQTAPTAGLLDKETFQRRR
jgi:hypothetical protein